MAPSQVLPIRRLQRESGRREEHESDSVLQLPSYEAVAGHMSEGHSSGRTALPVCLQESVIASS